MQVQIKFLLLLLLPPHMRSPERKSRSQGLSTFRKPMLFPGILPNFNWKALVTTKHKGKLWKKKKLALSQVIYDQKKREQ